MDRRHKQYQPTSTSDNNDDHLDEYESDEDVKETTAMMEGKNAEVKDLEHEDKVDEDVTGVEQLDAAHQYLLDQIAGCEAVGSREDLEGNLDEHVGPTNVRSSESLDCECSNEREPEQIVIDLGSEDGVDEDVTANEQVDAVDTPAYEVSEVDGKLQINKGDKENQGAFVINYAELDDGEIKGVEDEENVDKDARGQNTTSPIPNLNVEIPLADDGPHSPPPFERPPSYETAIMMSARQPMSYIEAVGRDELESSRDEHVGPTKLQNNENIARELGDELELEHIDQDSANYDARGAPSSNVAVTSFSQPSTYVVPISHSNQPHPTDESVSPSSGSLPGILLSNDRCRTWAVYIISVLIAIGALLMVILLPLTFSYIEYYQYGMKKGRVSGVVEFAKEVYDLGRYAIGPATIFKRYPAWAHLVNYDRIDFFTADGIVMDAQISFQYFIKEDELGIIEQKYDKSYKDIIRSVVEATIKNTAATYTTKDYLSQRGKVETGFHDAVRLKLGGNCCPDRDECVRLGSCHLCSDNQEQCNKGFHVDVRYLQLKQLSVPDDISERFLNVQLILEGNEEAVHRQNYQLQVKETEKLTEEILNAAAEITNNGTAIAELARKQGNTRANAVRELAHGRGLKLLYDGLNIEDEYHRASLHWIRTLERHQGLVSGVSFKDYISLIQGLGDDN